MVSDSIPSRFPWERLNKMIGDDEYHRWAYGIGFCENKLLIVKGKAMKTYTFTSETGERSVIHHEGEGYLVKFYNKDGVWMDASDYVTQNFYEALQVACPENENPVLTVQ